MLDGRFDRILPGFATINYTESTDQSHFHGGTVAFKVNRTELNLGGAYTFGKATDYSSSFSAAGRPDAYGPPDQDEGPGRLRRPAEARAVGELDDCRARRRAGAGARGGWQVAGVLIAQTGTPFSVVCNRGFIAVRDAAGKIVGNSGCDFNADNFTATTGRTCRRSATRRAAVERRLPERHLHRSGLPDPGARPAGHARTQHLPRAALLQRRPDARQGRSARRG